MRVGILGKGFGLYGYLPAFIDLGYRAVTLEKYRQEIEGRAELRSCLPLTDFVNSDSDVIEAADIIVVARNPTRQFRFIQDYEGGKVRLFLEKPLAPGIEDHKIALNLLREHSLNFSVGYIFKYTTWYQEIVDLVSRKDSKVLIDWEVASTFNSWKGDESAGGGLSAFYAVHFVELLEHLGVSYNTYFDNLSNVLSINGQGANGVNMEIILKYSDRSFFQVRTETVEAGIAVLYQSSSPLGEKGVHGKRDPRVSFLKEYIKDTELQTTGHGFLDLEEAVLRFRMCAEL